MMIPFLVVCAAALGCLVVMFVYDAQHYPVCPKCGHNYYVRFNGRSTCEVHGAMQ